MYGGEEGVDMRRDVDYVGQETERECGENKTDCSDAISAWPYTAESGRCHGRGARWRELVWRAATRVRPLFWCSGDEWLCGWLLLLVQVALADAALWLSLSLWNVIRTRSKLTEAAMTK